MGRLCDPQYATRTDWTDSPGTIRHWRRCRQIWRTSKSRTTADSWMKIRPEYPWPVSTTEKKYVRDISAPDIYRTYFCQTTQQECPADADKPARRKRMQKLLQFRRRIWWHYFCQPHVWPLYLPSEISHHITSLLMLKTLELDFEWEGCLRYLGYRYTVSWQEIK